MPVGFSRRNQVTHRRPATVRGLYPYIHVRSFPPYLVSGYLRADDENEFHRITINLDVIIINLERGSSIGELPWSRKYSCRLVAYIHAKSR